MGSSPSSFRSVLLLTVIASAVLTGCAAFEDQSIRGTPHVYAEVVNGTPDGTTAIDRRNESIRDNERIQTALSEVRPNDEYRKNVTDAEYRRLRELLESLPTDDTSGDGWGGPRGFYVETEVGVVRVSIDVIEAA